MNYDIYIYVYILFRGEIISSYGKKIERNKQADEERKK